jgi:hypothetical protein
VKSRWYALLLLAWTGAGCVWLPTTQEETKPAPPAKPAAPRPKRPTTLVTPEQVNEGNAHDMGNRLWDELDRDSQADDGKGPH